MEDQIEEVVTPEVTEEETHVEEVPVDEESIDDVKAKLAKAEEIAENQRIRAEKAEKKAKETKEAKTSDSLTTSDILAIVAAKVHEDDIERVERFAKAEGVTIKEALKNPELKAILNIREEQRTTAEASNVTNVRRGSTKITDDTLIQNATKGKLPESDEDIQRLIAAKLKRK